MTNARELSEAEWRTVLRRLFEVKGRRVRIPRDHRYTVEDADFHGIEVDSVPLPVAVAVLQAMARAHGTVSPEAMATLLQLATVTSPKQLSHEDLFGWSLDEGELAVTHSEGDSEAGEGSETS